ncbi:FRAS1-related extracellular matrix protein 1-like [Ascaphus truei]|uniref:FRAS1-related extracellular matrix protein 1-like n=1 Tax=Ascaphus truei TaxID=8439 RepID=UPI003F59EBAA
MSDNSAFRVTRERHLWQKFRSQCFGKICLSSSLVEHVDKSPPKILIKESPSTVDNIRDGRTAVQITANHLKASDPDSQDEDLIYMVLRPPYFGHLENAKTGGYVGSTFTQRDVNQRAIRYIINPAFEVNSDSFEFKLSDPAGNAILPEILELKWSIIELAEPYYRTCEHIGTLAVKVIRTGSSKDPAFVGIKVQEVSARVGLDFTHSTASLVQFDPGVSTKLWNIYIKNDGLEENHEVLKILLKTPKNAVLGKNSEAAIEIMDPRGGQCSSQASKTSDTGRKSENDGHSSRPQVGSENSRGPHRGESGATSKLSLTILPRSEGDTYKSHLLHRSGAAISGDVPSRPAGQQLQLTGSSVLYHGFVPMRGPQLNNRRADAWSVPVLSDPLASRHDLPQRDSALGDSHQPSTNATKQDKSPNKCPRGWTLRDKHCYHWNPIRNGTWEDAETTCTQVLNSHLTSVHSETEMKWLWKFANKKPFWIGLTSAGENSGWLWSNGRPVTFNNLKHMESSSAETTKERCVLVRRKKDWATRRCDKGQKERYICSLPVLNTNA